jgi:hypothetical protein
VQVSAVLRAAPNRCFAKRWLDSSRRPQAQATAASSVVYGEDLDKSSLEKRIGDFALAVRDADRRAKADPLASVAVEKRQRCRPSRGRLRARSRKAAGELPCGADRQPPPPSLSDRASASEPSGRSRSAQRLIARHVAALKLAIQHGGRTVGRGAIMMRRSNGSRLQRFCRCICDSSQPLGTVLPFEDTSLAGGL